MPWPNDPDVTYISPNRKVRGSMDPVVTAVNADIASSQGWDGTGVGIAVIDSGVDTVDDLNSDGNSSPSRVVYSQSFVPGDSSIDGRLRSRNSRGWYRRWKRLRFHRPAELRERRIAESRRKPTSSTCAYWTALAPASTAQ